MKKLIELASKVNPVWALILLVLALVPIFFLLWTNSRQKKRITDLSILVSKDRELLERQKALQIFEQEEKERERSSTKVKEMESQLKLKEVELQRLQTEAALSTDKIKELSGWEEIKWADQH